MVERRRLRLSQPIAPQLWLSKILPTKNTKIRSFSLEALQFLKRWLLSRASSSRSTLRIKKIIKGAQIRGDSYREKIK